MDFCLKRHTLIITILRLPEIRLNRLLQCFITNNQGYACIHCCFGHFKGYKLRNLLNFIQISGNKSACRVGQQSVSNLPKHYSMQLACSRSHGLHLAAITPNPMPGKYLRVIALRNIINFALIVHWSKWTACRNKGLAFRPVE